MDAFGELGRRGIDAVGDELLEKVLDPSPLRFARLKKCRSRSAGLTTRLRCALPWQAKLATKFLRKIPTSRISYPVEA